MSPCADGVDGDVDADAGAEADRDADVDDDALDDTHEHNTRTPAHTGLPGLQ